MLMQQWHQFIQESTVQAPAMGNINIANGTVVDFGDSDAERRAVANSTVICDLSHFGLLQLQGADTLTFLQGQVTNDIKQLNGHNAHYSGYCNPKGRLLALFLAFSHHDHVCLQMPKELIDAIAKRLKMYVMRSKVEIQDVSESVIKIGLNGHNAVDLLKPLFKHVPQNVYELSNSENGALLRLPGATPRYEIFADAASAPVIWNALKLHARPVGAACWEWLEIQAGIPEVTLKTQEEFVPQMLNLDALGAINYKKGCYTGQEIVARTHYLGKVKRRTQLAHIASTETPESGDDVMDDNKQTIGKIVRCAPSTDTGYDVLVECRLESLQENSIYWNEKKLTIKALPYALDNN